MKSLPPPATEHTTIAPYWIEADADFITIYKGKLRILMMDYHDSYDTDRQKARTLPQSEAIAMAIMIVSLLNANHKEHT